MAEDIDVGRLVASIVLDTQSLQEGNDSVKEELSKLADPESSKIKIKTEIDKQTLNYVVGAMESIGIKTEDMVGYLNAAFGKGSAGLSNVRNYGTALEDLAAKIELCQNQMQSLGNQNDMDDTTIQQYQAALSALENQYDSTAAKLDEYVKQVVNSVDEYRNSLNMLESIGGVDIVSIDSELKVWSYADSIEYVREVLDKLGISGKEADDIICNCFSDTSGLQKYQNQLEITAQKIENQKQVVAELESKKMQAQNLNNSTQETKIAAQLEREKVKLMELEAKYNDIFAQQDNYVARAATSYQKVADASEIAAQRQAAAAESVAEKEAAAAERAEAAQNKKDIAGSVTMLTSSLRTFNAISPGAISNVTNLIRQINTMRKAMQSGASSAIVWSNAIIMGVGILMTIINGIVSNIQEAEKEAEEAKQKAIESAAESSEALKETADSVKDLSAEYKSLKTQLNKYNISREEEINIKNQLYALQEKLVEQYGNEAKTIDLVTGSIENQEQAIKNLQKAEDERYVAENYNAYEEAKSSLQETMTFDVGVVYTTKNSALEYDDEQYALKKLFEEVWSAEMTDEIFKDGGGWSEVYSIELNLEEAEDKLAAFHTAIDKWVSLGRIDAKQANEIYSMLNEATDQMNLEDIADKKEIVETYEATDKRLKGVISSVDELQTAQDKINQTMQNSISAVQEYDSSMQDLEKAYQTIVEGGNLDANTLSELCEKYPELAKYIDDTGDLTLDSGNKLTELYKQNKEALENTLRTEKEALEEQAKLLGSDEKSLSLKEDIMARINEINAELHIYNNETLDISKQQEKMWKTVSGELNDLAGAYQTLSASKKLDLDTVLELIDKYPELAKAMAETGSFGEAQISIFEALFEAKKNDYILTQQCALDNIRAAQDEAKAVIASITTQIAMYGFKLQYLAQIAYYTAEIAKLEEEAEKYEAKIKELQNLSIDDYSSGSGSGSTKNEALQEELKLLDHKKAIGQLTSQQELNWLNRINQTYSMNTDEKMDMEKRLYNVKKQLQEEEEQAAEDALNAEYDRIDNLKSLGKLTTQQELYQLEQIRKKYKLNAEQAMELEIKLYNLKKELKQEEIDSLDTLADAVTEALKNKYQEQQKAEEKLIDESIENWQKWEDETTKAIQAEIDALDELSKTQESENARQKYEQKRQATALQLAYEKDDYNRKQLEKELARLDKEEAQRLLEEEIEARKAELQAQMKTVQETSSAAQEKLEAEKEALAENYEELTREFSLRAEAEKVILNSTQQETVALIKSYAPEYNMAGQSLGEALYEGMKSKVDNIISYVAQLESYVDSYQTKLAATANAATDDFWANRSAYEQELASMSVDSSSAAQTIVVQQTINFNQPVESPVEVKRQLEETSQALAQQIASGI